MLGLALFMAGTAQAQNSAVAGCNTVRVYPIPINAERPLTAQVARLCPSSSPLLASVESEVVGNVVLIEADCTDTILPSFSCQTGQVDIGGVDPGEYLIEVYDPDLPDPLFTETFRVSAVSEIPTLSRPGVLVLAVLLAVMAGYRLFERAGRGRFSNRRS